MCMVIYKPKDEHVTKKTLKRCWNNNNDGAGFMYAGDNKLHIVKGLMCFNAFYKTYRAQENKLNTDYIIHFRIGTAGKNNQANCHPFKINENVGFAHNGILNCVNIPTKSSKSDTAVFCEEFLQKLTKDFLFNSTILEVLEVIAFSENSKFVFMDNFGFVCISNEVAGVWDSGIWYSNDGYKTSDFSMGFTSTADVTKIEEQDWAECADCGAYFPAKEMCLILRDYYLCEDCYKTERAYGVEYGRKV